jgi:hypothetical protein
MKAKAQKSDNEVQGKTVGAGLEKKPGNWKFEKLGT